MNREVDITVSDLAIIITCQETTEYLLHAIRQLAHEFPEKRYELEKICRYVLLQQQQGEKTDRITEQALQKLKETLHRTVILKTEPQPPNQT